MILMAQKGNSSLSPNKPISSMSRSPQWDRRPPDRPPDIHPALVGSVEASSESSASPIITLNRIMEVGQELQATMNVITQVAEARWTLHVLFRTKSNP